MQTLLSLRIKTASLKKLFSAAIALVTAASAAGLAQAQSNHASGAVTRSHAVPETAYTWFTGTSGNYSDGTKWSPTGVPLNPGDSGTVPGTATYTITLDASPNIDFFAINNPNATLFFTGLNSMTTSGAFTNSGTVEIPTGDNNLLHAASITNNSGSVIKVDNVSGLHIQTPTLTNNGAITINQSTVGNTTNLNITGDVTLGGSGTVSGSNVIGNRLFGDNATERLTVGTSQTIQGSLTLGNMSFTNNGIFNANVSQGMTLNPIGSIASINNGTMEASNGSTLTLTNSRFGGEVIYTNNGTIKALASSFVSLSNNPTIVGGTLTTADLTGSGGVIQPFDLATLQDVTNTGFLNIPDFTTLQLLGTLTNNGVLMLNGGANGVSLVILNDVTITGTGVVSSSNTQLNQIQGLNGTERLTVDSGMTIQGSFTLGFASLRLTNNGVINANLSNGAIVRPTDAVGDFVNNGIVEASNGATLSLSSLNITNTNGTIQALAGSIVKLNAGGSGTQVDGGTMIANDGSIQYSSFGAPTASSRVEILGTGNFDISGCPVTVGSIEGDGSIFLGSQKLTTGITNLTTTFSGVMQDGGVSGGTLGSLTKIGTGTLSVSGANTYTGGTTVQGGRLLVLNATGSATGTGFVQVNASILGGRGTIKGPVTMGTNAVLAPRTSGRQFGLLNMQSALRFKSRATYSFALDTVTHRADMLLAKSVTISNGAFFSLVSLGAATLPPGSVFTAINNTAARPIAGTFSNLADGATLTVNGNTFQANYEGGDGNDLTLTVVP